ncbi:sulfotransferase domain-containing protein [Cohnella sp. WQ 127256]|uniref:sulfotransferase domain-containing protein n=1 Tax=Cohnella sp. WQ 127256 TaxID=2938790 RepID=UPI002117D946|nr:sulfotransferase domain-containing protein [Cohnella sp. WQ 127256]
MYLFKQLSEQRMPDFVIIGAQKAGTTSLYHYLNQHPVIAGAVVKEVHYFDLNYDKPREWYLQFFPSLLEKKRRLTGEASPYYLFHPLAARRLRETLPDAKIIVILRNPIDRAYSHYHHSVRNLGETLTFEQAIACEEVRLMGMLEKFREDPYYFNESHQHHSYLSRGIYVDQLEEWHRYCPSEKILILSFEDFFGGLPDSMRKVTDFLGVQPYEFQYKPLNVGRYEEISTVTRKHLQAYFAPHNERLYRMLERGFDWD